MQRQSLLASCHQTVRLSALTKYKWRFSSCLRDTLVIDSNENRAHNISCDQRAQRPASLVLSVLALCDCSEWSSFSPCLLDGNYHNKDQKARLLDPIGLEDPLVLQLSAWAVQLEGCALPSDQIFILTQRFSTWRPDHKMYLYAPWHGYIAVSVYINQRIMRSRF